MDIRVTFLERQRGELPQVPEELGHLPAGYGPEELASDALAAMLEPPAKPAGHLRELASQLHRAALLGYQRCPPTITQSRRLASDLYRFWHRLRRHPLRQALLDYADGDPQQAASLLLQLLAWQRETPSGEEADGIGALGLQLLRAAQHGLLWPLGEGDMGGHGAGRGHRSLSPRTWQVARLLPKLRLEYEPYSRRATLREESPWPDDLDVSPLRSLSSADVARLLATEWARDEDEFYYRLAARQAAQAIYTTPKPAPPRRIAMLIDVSGSMRSPLDRDGAKRADYAIASAIALLQSALKGGHLVRVMLFDAEPCEPPLEGSPEQVAAQLLECPFSGGGTSIDTALQAIAEWQPEEVILITDGDDHVTYDPPYRLVVYQMGHQPNRHLRRRAARYQHVRGEVEDDS